jgi:hypothetical protein
MRAAACLYGQNKNSAAQTSPFHTLGFPPQRAFGIFVQSTHLMVLDLVTLTVSWSSFLHSFRHSAATSSPLGSDSPLSTLFTVHCHTNCCCCFRLMLHRVLAPGYCNATPQTFQDRVTVLLKCKNGTSVWQCYLRIKMVLQCHNVTYDNVTSVSTCHVF